MAYLIVADCRIARERMQDFTAEVQRWEQDAMQDEDGPRHHAVYLGDSDPSRVLIVTEFDSKAHADRFAEKGLLGAFEEAVLRSMLERPVLAGYDLYYAATPGGPTVAFGQSTGR